MSDNFDVRLVENAKYYTPDADYKRSSWIGDYQNTYRRFLADPDAFWETIAKELNWIRPWDQVCEWKYPYARWFVNAQSTSPQTVSIAMLPVTTATRWP